MSASSSASGRFGVTSKQSGKSRSTRISSALSEVSRSPWVVTMTGSNTKGCAARVSPFGDGEDIVCLTERPSLGDVRRDVLLQAGQLIANEVRVDGVDRAHAARVLYGEQRLERPSRTPRIGGRSSGLPGGRRRPRDRIQQ